MEKSLTEDSTDECIMVQTLTVDSGGAQRMEKIRMVDSNVV
jgi:hypothetical protein